MRTWLSLSLTLLSLEVGLSRAWTCSAPAWQCQAVMAAGEEREETVRYELLVSLSQEVKDDIELAAEMEELLVVVDKWANGLEKYWRNDTEQVTGEDGYLGGWFMFLALPWGPPWPPQPRPQSPLHPLWCLYRGRMLIWSAVENGFRYHRHQNYVMWRFSVVY